MTDDQSAHLDHLLCLWHHWQKGDKLTDGHSGKSQVVGQCRGYGLQYESQLEQQDVALDNATCETINAQVNELGEPHRTAILIDARNLYTGIAVWDSHRITGSPQERALILATARHVLMKRLIAAGVMNVTDFA